MADVVDGRITDGESEIVQGPNNTVATPGRGFLDQLDDEFFYAGAGGAEGWQASEVGVAGRLKVNVLNYRCSLKSFLKSLP